MAKRERTNPDISQEQLAELRTRAAETRKKLEGKRTIEEVLTPDEVANATPFYFALRGFVSQLRSAREEAGLTQGDIATKAGVAVETVSRLETGILTNPTYKLLAAYALAVGRSLSITAEPLTAK